MANYSALIRFINRHCQVYGVKQVRARHVEDHFMPELLADAIKEGVVRKGVDGYWLPEAPDPGFVTVMNNQDKE